MGTFEYLQRKSSTGPTPAPLTSHLLQSSRPLAPAPVSAPGQASADQQMQSARGTPLKYSFADIPVFPPARENRTGLPDNLKAGIESLSSMAMDDVQVHYNSPKPAEVQALAYTRGTEIYVGHGQEKHLPHEAWHVVQQMQGRIRPTIQMKGVEINDDEGLEKEAHEMGERANQVGGGSMPGKDVRSFDLSITIPSINPFMKSSLSKRDAISRPSTTIQKIGDVVPLIVLAYGQGIGCTTAQVQFAWSISNSDILLRAVRMIINREHAEGGGAAQYISGLSAELDEVLNNLSRLRANEHPQLAGAQRFVAHLKLIMRTYSQGKILGGIPMVEPQ